MVQSDTRNESVTVNATSVQVCQAATGSPKRKQMIFTNTSSTQTITLVKGSQAAVANAGIVLLPSGSYLESTDAGFTCWQGSVQAISSAASGSLSIVEDWE